MTYEHLVAFDTETALIRPGLPAPPMACLTYQFPGWPAGLMHHTHENLRGAFVGWLESATLVGHNVAYDMAVCAAKWPDLLPLIYKAYDEDRVTDTMIRQQLIDIAAGCFRGKQLDNGEYIKYDYSLQAVTKRLTGRWLEKDEWRLRYGELIDVPIEQWPEGAKTYPKEDAAATLDCFLVQERDKQFMQSQFHEARAALALHLTSAWGLRTNGAKVRRLREETEDERSGLLSDLCRLGLVRADGSRDTKKAKALMEEACGRAGLTVRLTKTGQVALDADSCDYSQDDTLEDYARYTTLGKILSADVPMLEKGTELPIHSHFGLAGSGRCTSASPNVQNLRRMERK